MTPDAGAQVSSFGAMARRAVLAHLVLAAGLWFLLRGVHTLRLEERRLPPGFATGTGPAAPAVWIFALAFGSALVAGAVWLAGAQGESRAKAWLASALLAVCGVGSMAGFWWAGYGPDWVMLSLVSLVLFALASPGSRTQFLG